MPPAIIRISLADGSAWDVTGGKAVTLGK